VSDVKRRITRNTGTVIMVMDTRNMDMTTNTDLPKSPPM